MTTVLAIDVSEIAIPFFLNYPENSTIHLHLRCTKNEIFHLRFLQ